MPRRSTRPRRAPGGVVGGPRAALLANGDPRGAARARRRRRARRRAGGRGAPGSRGRAPGTQQARHGARSRLRAGFPGAVSTAAAFQLDAGDRRRLAPGARRTSRATSPITVTPCTCRRTTSRWWSSAAWRSAWNPFPRRFRPGEACRLRGEVVGSLRSRARLPDPTRRQGRRDAALRTRRLTSRCRCSEPGVYRVEVMSDGATGPVVLANVPIYVGVDEPRLGVAVAASRRRPARRPGAGGGADARAAQRSPPRGGPAAAGRRSRAARGRDRAHRGHDRPRASSVTSRRRPAWSRID